MKKGYIFALAASCMATAAFVSLWVILGVCSGMGAAYYTVCGILSVCEVMTSAVDIKERIRFILHHREERMK